MILGQLAGANYQENEYWQLAATGGYIIIARALEVAVMCTWDGLPGTPAAWEPRPGYPPGRRRRQTRQEPTLWPTSLVHLRCIEPLQSKFSWSS